MEGHLSPLAPWPNRPPAQAAAQASARFGPDLGGPPRQADLWAKAQEFEACFLAEMLAHAGLGSGENGFSGGFAEAQFSSFLGEAQARLLVEKGGLGLAENLYRAMGGAYG